jgi:2',3'-cyclic-nucleotide 2'-phosphodiesterase / 3'-nucleotidase
LQDVKRLDSRVDNNWQLQAAPGVKLRFTSGAGDMAHLQRHPQIQLVEDNGDGSALYEPMP